MHRLSLITVLLLAVPGASAQVAPETTVPAAQASPQVAQAVRSYRAGDFAAAARGLERAVQNNPDIADLRLMFVSALLQDGRARRANLAAQAALERFPDHLGLLMLRGEVEFRIDLPVAALETLERARSRLDAGATPPGGFEAHRFHRRLGQLHQVAGGRAVQDERYEAALAHFREARTFLPDSASVYQNEVYTLIKLERWEEASRVTADGLERFPEHEPLLRAKVQVLAQRGAEPQELIPTLRRLYQRRPDDLDVGLTYGRALMAARRSQAETVLDELQTRFPDERRLYDALAEIYQSSFNVPAAIEVRRKEQRRFPDDREVPRQIARLYEQIGEFNEARAVYDSLRTLGGSASIEDARARARTFVRQDSLAAAEAAYRELVECSPGDGEALRALADLLERRAQWEEANAAFGRLATAARTSEERAYALAHRGRALEHLGHADRAFGAYEEARALEADDPLSYYRHAVILRRRDGPEAAYPHAREALRKGLSAVEILEAELTGRLEKGAATSPRTGAREERRRIEAVNELAVDIFTFYGEAFPREKTEPVVRALLRRYEGSGRLSYLAGRYFEKHGDTAEALRRYTDAAREAPELRDAHLASAAIYERQRRTHDAILAYERALALDEEAPDARRALIRLYRDQNRLDVLIRRWEARYRATPENDVLRDHLIEALHKAERYEEARAYADTGSDPGS